MDATLVTEAVDGLEDIEIHLLLEALYRRYHYDFRHYAQASLKRRLRQACQQLGFLNLSALQDAVLHDATMVPRLLDYLTVQVSESGELQALAIHAPNAPESLTLAIWSKTFWRPTCSSSTHPSLDRRS